MSVTGQLDGDDSAEFQGEIPDLGDDLEFYPESAIDRLTEFAEKLHLKFLVTVGAAGMALGVFLINYQ